MQKEQLKKYLNNQPLAQAIRQRKQIDDTRKKLYSAINIANEAGLTEVVTSEIKAKCDEYNKISQGYSNMIEDTWGLTWQNEAIISRYVNCPSDEIDKLGDEIY